MTLATGSRLGPYEIVGHLGAGGMGEVYRARDTRLGRMVAIKTLPDRFADDPSALARFEREARAVAALSHPNILAIHDFGTENGVCYTVMELLEGQSIREAIRSEHLGWSRVAEIGAAVAEGLATAHGKGIIHRDLKPDNLFLTTDGHVKILDFGLARMETAHEPRPETEIKGPDTGTDAYIPGPLESMHTVPGAVMGTAGYMAPEQVRGETVDSRADIFALGCVLYEMLAGKRAFPGKTRQEIHTATLNHDPSPFVEGGHDVPMELDRLIRRCLEKRPENRYQSARDLAHDLRDLRFGSSIAHAHVPMVRRSSRLVFVIGAGLGSLMLIAAVVAVFKLSGDRPAPDTDVVGPSPPVNADPAGSAIEAIAILPFDNLNRDPSLDFLSNGLSESIIINLSSLRGLKVRPFGSVASYKDQKPDLKLIGGELKVQAILTGRLLKQPDRISISVELIDVRDNSHLWGERYTPKATELVSIEEEIAKRISDKLRVRLNPDEQRRQANRHTPPADAFQLYLQGRHYFNTSSSEEQTKKAIDHYQQAIAKDPKYALAYAATAEAYYWLSNIFQAPTEVIPKAKEAARKAIELDDSLGEAHAMIGLFHTIYDWDWKAAEESFRRAVSLSPSSATVRLYFSIYLTDVQRFDDALVELDRAMECDPSSLFIRVYTVYPLILARRAEKALPQLLLMNQTDQKHFLPYAFLGLAYEQLGEYEKAIDAFQTSLKLESSNLEGKAQLGHTYAVAKRRDEALKILKELTELPKGRYVSPYNIAVIHIGLGNYDQAFEWLNKAIDDHSEWLSAIRVDARLDPIRKDPRFARVLAATKLTP
jgi:serine/threonine-protein kinase